MVIPVKDSKPIFTGKSDLLTMIYNPSSQSAGREERGLESKQTLLEINAKVPISFCFRYTEVKLWRSDAFVALQVSISSSILLERGVEELEPDSDAKILACDLA